MKGELDYNKKSHWYCTVSDNIIIYKRMQDKV